MNVPSLVSVAMIVRDEAAYIVECIESIKSLGPELCVVDTGSTDDTASIAREMGAVVSSFPWCDDFAAARNYSLTQCHGQWVFVLDADERIAPSDIPRLQSLLTASPDRFYRFVTRNYANKRAVSGFNASAPGDGMTRGFAGWFPSTKVRLFPNLPEVRFEGTVHETVAASLGRLGIPPAMADLPIHHYPLLRNPGRIAAKQRMYIELGLAKVKAAPQDPQAYAELGNQYAELGDYEAAAFSYRESLRRYARDPLVLRDLGSVLFLLGRPNEAIRALELALELAPDMADAWQNLGIVLDQETHWADAAGCFERALASNPQWDPALLDSYTQLSVQLGWETRASSFLRHTVRPAIPPDDAQRLAPVDAAIKRLASPAH
jgi:glycosyltransferase involved in cell wall biosynthesis